MEPAIGAAGALLEYARKMQGQALAHVAAVIPERASEYLRMDAATRRNLELTETLRGEPAPTLFSVLDACATGMGSRLLRHWLHHPLRDHSALNERLEAVAALAEAHAGIAKLLRRFADVERITGRIALKNARPRDLSSLRDSLALLPELEPAVPRGAPLLAKTLDDLEVPAECLALLKRAVLEDPASMVRDGGVIACFAAVSSTRNYCRPEFAGDIVIEIDAGRHPVVEAQIDPFIANGTRLAPSRQLLLITGPNMGGKSTYMRQVALIVLMAHAGSFVPAKAARLGPIDQIFTRVGAADDLAGGRSTFMVEMTESANILHNATERSLVLMDEVGRGTSTFDGLALAWAIARQLLERNKSLTLFATHYFEMTRLALEYKQAVNVHLDAVEHKETIVFLHAVEEGPASRSYGLQVAQLAGLPENVIRNARRYLQMLEEASLTQGGQNDLFASGKPEPDAPPESDTLRDALAAVSPDELSPREALELLYKLKRL